LKSGSGFLSLVFLFLYLRLSPLRVFASSSGANRAPNPLQEQQASGIGEKNPGPSGFALAESLREKIWLATADCLSCGVFDKNAFVVLT
jgi:hypothetical protein